MEGRTSSGSLWKQMERNPGLGEVNGSSDIDFS